MAQKNIETIPPSTETIVETSKKVGVLVVGGIINNSGLTPTASPDNDPASKNRSHELVQTFPFHRNENGLLRPIDSSFPNALMLDFNEIEKFGIQLSESLEDVFGDLESLDMETVTVEQIREAFGGIKENFNLRDIFDLELLIGWSDTKLIGDSQAAVNIRAMNNMLLSDYAMRLAEGAKQVLGKNNPSMNDVVFIFEQFDNIEKLDGKLSVNSLEIAEQGLDLIKQHPELLSDKAKMFRWLTCFYQHEKTTKDGVEIIIKLLCENNTDLVDKDETTKLKLAEEIKHYIYLYLSTERQASDIQANYENFESIENEIPGIAKFLEKELGVIDFGRYPKQLLLDQYLLKEDVDSPYGVLLYPDSDYNGAFHDNQSVLAEFYEKLQALGVNLRISERDGKFGAARSLLGFDKKYGGKQKISFAIIGGHGTANSIQFGDAIVTSDKNGSLRTEDLAGSGVQRSLRSDFFVENPTIILNSCSTGVKKGIGQNISEIIDGELIAPNRITSLSKIEVILDDEKKLHFKVEYEDKKDVDVRYVGGQKVSDIA